MEDLRICQVAKIADCHINTVKNHEKRGHIQPLRDINGFRRYSLKQALKLKEILATRVGEQNGSETNSRS